MIWAWAWELTTYLLCDFGQEKVSFLIGLLELLNVCDYVLSTLKILIIWTAEIEVAFPSDFTFMYKSHLPVLFSCVDSYS